MEVGRTPSGRLFGVCVDNVMPRRRETPRSSFCAPPRGYFATISPTAKQPENVCKEVKTQLEAVAVELSQDKCFFKLELPAAAPQFLALCDVEQLFVCLARVDATNIWESLTDKDEALAHLHENLISRAPWEECLRSRAAFRGEDAASKESINETDDNLTFKVECDCACAKPSVLSSEDIVENASRMLQEKFGWTMDSSRAALEVQLFVTDTSFVAGLLVLKSSTSASQSHEDSPPDATLADAVQELHLGPDPAEAPVAQEPSESGTGPPAVVDKREEAKRRRTEEKRRKEQEKRQKEQEKKKAATEEVARQKQEARERRKAAREARGDSDVVCTIYQTTTLSEADIRRAEAKDARESVRQQQWAYNDADMTKNELRDYYKSMKSKPKGKNPDKTKRAFADQ